MIRLKTALSRAYPDAFPWMIQLQFLTCEHLFDRFLIYIDEYRKGIYESIDVTEEEWHWCREEDPSLIWPDLRGMEFFHDFDAALKLPATHSSSTSSRTC